MNKKNKNLLLKWQYSLAPIYFIGPSLLLFSLFVLWPILQSFWISLHSWSGFGPMTWIGLDNYKELLKDPEFHTSLINNIQYLFLLLLAPACGLGIALFLNQTIKGIRIIKSLFFFPFVINLVVVGLIFSWFYNPDLGLLAKLMSYAGLDPIPVLADENLAIYGIILAALWPQTAYTMILFLTGLTSMNTQVIEAGKIDGASGLSMLRHVVLPQLRGAAFIAAVVTIIGALRSFDLVAIMTAGGPWGSTSVLAYFMYREALTNFHMGYGAAVSVILFFIMSFFIAMFLRSVVKNER